MKIRAIYTSGIPTQDYNWTGTLEEFFVYYFGNRILFENRGGRIEILEEAPVSTAEPVEEAPKPKAKKKNAE